MWNLVAIAILKVADYTHFELLKSDPDLKSVILKPKYIILNEYFNFLWVDSRNLKFTKYYVILLKSKLKLFIWLYKKIYIGHMRFENFIKKIKIYENEYIYLKIK